MTTDETKEMEYPIVLSGWKASLEEFFPLEEWEQIIRNEEQFLPSFLDPLEFDGDTPIPIYMRDNEGNFLFTPGQLHWVYGAPGAFKSYLLQTAVLNHHGVYVDLESTPRLICKRLKTMSANYFERSRWGFPETEAEVMAIIDELCKIKPTLVVIDSFVRLVAVVSGGDSNNDQDVAVVISRVFRPLLNKGHAVVIADHIAKNPTNSDYPVGSFNKKAQSDVCMYIEKDDEGNFSTIRITKDRYGVYYPIGIYEGMEYGEMFLNPKTGRMEVAQKNSALYLSKKAQSDSLKVSQDAVFLTLSELGPLNRTTLAHYAGGKSETVKRAIDELLILGVVQEERKKSESGGIGKIISLTGNPWTVAPTNKNTELKKKLKYSRSSK